MQIYSKINVFAKLKELNIVVNERNSNRKETIYINLYS